MRYLPLLLVMLIFTACQPQQPAQEESIDMDALRATLQSMEDAYAKAWNARDAEAVVAYYADVPMAGGQGDAQISFQVIDVFADGDLAVEVGQTTMSRGGSSEVVGKYISVFEKRNGEWICIRDSYSDNSDDDEETETTEGN